MFREQIHSQTLRCLYRKKRCIIKSIGKLTVSVSFFPKKKKEEEEETIPSK